MLRFVRLVAVLFALALIGCARPSVPPVPPLTFVQSDVDAKDMVKRLSPRGQSLSSWQELAPALERSLAFTAVKPRAGVALEGDGLTLTWGQLHDSIAKLLEILPRLDAEPELLTENFAWFRLTQGVLMTGYYVPYVEASSVRTAEYRYPIYGLPDDLRKLDLGEFHPRWKGQRLIYRVEHGEAVPYPERAEIDFEGALSGRGLEIAWARDLVDVFFLQIQGSGLLHFPDGSRHLVGYAGKNGHRYVSLGRVLVRRGLMDLEHVSMKSIREYLAAHPEEVPALLSTNPSYVFFRLGEDGPVGAMGKMLTPKVSMATDPKFLPLGSLLAFEADLPPEAPGEDDSHVAGLGLAQDTGGAITGARVDWFCGSGPEVEFFAGHIKNPASIHLLVSKEVLK
ncbi:membrane-bound lytic murein transglycosylase A [Desulfobaculum xiamenense]|uniref:peptidoglycan lytic exotransglycosylase n=1 Tax=Desulfobaculum xiamenense TaxID=995050 RepID=A0A846QKI9_9BACT|nr:MltA domain-containing protein [Desulfobaculum xiamenense]NJB66972.1 membrane-bound lytic murein transglycosylase A [Desulfobaculum xiamenense]